MDVHHAKRSSLNLRYSSVVWFSASPSEIGSRKALRTTRVFSLLSDIVHKDGTAYRLVAESTSRLCRKVFTSGLPIILDRLIFQTGHYFRKRGVIGEITEMIGQDGAMQDFILAE